MGGGRKGGDQEMHAEEIAHSLRASGQVFLPKVRVCDSPPTQDTLARSLHQLTLPRIHRVRNKHFKVDTHDSGGRGYINWDVMRLAGDNEERRTNNGSQT